MPGLSVINSMNSNSLSCPDFTAALDLVSNHHRQNVSI